jgi:hypothetical protein
MASHCSSGLIAKDSPKLLFKALLNASAEGLNNCATLRALFLSTPTIIKPGRGTLKIICFELGATTTDVPAWPGSEIL